MTTTTAMEVNAHNGTPRNSPAPHDILWFPSGDVVLTTGSFLFKVHKDILSFQSSVFRDMFQSSMLNKDTLQAVDQGAVIVAEMHEGLSLVELVGDNPKDVVHLLRTVYDTEYHNCREDQTPLDVVIALLSLSTKYDFSRIRSEVIQQISNVYPTTLDAYDEIDEDDGYIFDTNKDLCHFRLLKALFTANVEPLLPVLYYSCSRFDIPNILGNLDLLGVECFATLLKGRERLKDAIALHIARLPDDLNDASTAVCPSFPKCFNSARASKLTEFVNSTDLKEPKGGFIVQSCVKQACGPCATFIADTMNHRRGHIWSHIPLYFGFPGWDDLRQKLEEIIEE